MSQQITLNLTNEGDYGAWAKGVIMGNREVKAMPRASYNDHAFVSANADDFANLFVYSYIKKSLKAHLTQYVGDTKFLTPANANELDKESQESVSRGFTAYTLHPENTPIKLKNEISNLFESSKEIALKYINERLADFKNFSLDSREMDTKFPNFEVAINKTNGKNVFNFNLAMARVKNGETSVKPDQSLIIPMHKLENDE